MHRPGIRSTAPVAAALAVTGLAACGGNHSSVPPPAHVYTAQPSATPTGTASAAPANAGGLTGVNPCSLLTDAQVKQIAPHVGHKADERHSGVRDTCDWPNATGVPVVQLQVSQATTTSLVTDLTKGIDAHGGFTVVPVSGVGDEAAAAFQNGDPSKGVTTDLAVISVRSGSTIVSLYTPLLSIQQHSAGFANVKKLMSAAITHLPGAG